VIASSVAPLILTPGDPDGIGPEITWNAVRSYFKDGKRVPILCVGAKRPFEKLKAPIIEVTSLERLAYPKRTKPFIWLMPAPEKAAAGLHLEGYQAGWSIERATHLVLEGKGSALVTGPISKDRLQKGGFIYPGHTEFLAALCQTPEVTMMLANQTLRVTLVTTHVGLHEVSQVLTRSKIHQTVIQTAQSLKNLWGIQKPKIAVSALNPHAGEAGLFGREEIDTIEPEIQALKKLGAKRQFSFEVFGPLPADTLFAKHVLAPKKKRFDAVVCMYHDQGLIPVKLLDFHNTVNVTLGLPVIRTSVDHGVGFDIAGKGIADESSLLAAIQLATVFVQKKRRLHS
jgi:4-hydroxythreonine-4-phosphate dehydrogenase